jgi:hypothetical protein
LPRKPRRKEVNAEERGNPDEVAEAPTDFIREFEFVLLEMEVFGYS